MRPLHCPYFHDRRGRHPLGRRADRRLVALLSGLLLSGAGCSVPDARDEAGAARAASEASAASGEVVVAEAYLQPTHGRWPAAASGGSQYLTVWEDFRAGRSMLYGGRVGADGAALDAAGIPLLDVEPVPGTSGHYESAVAFDGTSFLVVTTVYGQVHGVRVSGAGEVLDPGGFAIATTGSPAQRPSVVFDGEQYLVAWARGAAPGRLDSGIYHARVKPDGTVLDPGGVRAFALAAPLTQVGASFDGTSYLLSWVDLDAEGRPGLHAARIATDGAPIDQAAFRVSPSGLRVDGRVSPVAGFDGTNHVLLWLNNGDDDDGYIFEVMVSRVSPAGQNLDPQGIVADLGIVDDTSVNRMALSAGSGRSVVTWSQDFDGEGGPSAAGIHVVQVAANGTPSPHPASDHTHGLEGTLVAHADGALLLWRDGDDLFGEHTRIAGARLDATGAPVTGGAVAPASTASSQDVRGVATDGQIFFVVWADSRDPESEGKALYGARIAADGTPLDGDGIAITTGIADVADVVFDGASFVVTWAEHTGGEGDGSPFRFVRVSPAGELVASAPQPQLLASPDHTMASASDGTHTLLVGEDYNSSESVLAAVLVDQDGVAASDVIDILTKDEAVHAVEPAVSFDGTGYLVVWNDQQEVFGQLVSAEGALVGGRISIIGGRRIEHATAAAGGGNHMVIWQDGEGIFATRVSPAGAVLDPEGQLVAPLENLCDTGGCCVRPDLSTGACPSVAFDGASFLVAWRAPAIAGDAGSLDLHGAEVTPDGDVLRTFPISEEPEREGAPYVVASAGKQVLAAYARFVPGAPYHARRALARVLGPTLEPGPGPDAGPVAPGPDAGGSPADPPGDGGDCGCTVGAAQPTPVAPLLLLGGVIALWLVRRRSAR